MAGGVRTTAQSPATGIAVVFAALAAVAAAVGVVSSGASYKPSPAGLGDPGAIVGWGLPIANAIMFGCAIVTVGWLLLAAFLDPDARQGVVSRRGRTALLRAAAAAGIWCVAALASAALTLADILGISLGSALHPGAITTYVWDIQNVRTLILSAVLAAIVAIGCVVTVRLTTATAWLVLAAVAVGVPVLTGHAGGLGDHGLALVAGVAHVVAAAAWIGGVLALATLAWSRDPGLRVAATRFSPVAVACVLVLTASGFANAYTRLAQPQDLVTSGYGRLVLIKTLLLVVLVFFSYRMRKRILPGMSALAGRLAFVKFAGIELLLLAAATGLGIALSLSAPTRTALQLPTAGETLLGRPYPPAPTVANVLFGFRLDVIFLVIGLVGAILYVVGVVRLRRRGDHWPWYRTALWLTGLAIVVWATNAGIATYSDVSVGFHMVQHMTLAMLAPIPLVLAAPMTLALRAIRPSPSGGRGPRELILATLHSGPARVITNPIFVLFVYAGGIYALYLSPLFGALMGSHLGHIAMTAHFLLSGLLLAWVAIGIDPQPRPLPYWSRMILVLAAIVLHAFFAVAMMFTTSAIGAPWYTVVRPPWAIDPVTDSMQGGQIAWAGGEIPTILLLLIIAYQWSRSDDREAARRDRKVDRDGDIELDDYNAYLAELDAASNRRSSSYDR